MRSNQSSLGYSLNKLYKSIGISKQAFHQYTNRSFEEKSIESQLLHLVYKIREDHPTMGLRDMYYMLSEPGVGRDKFELICKNAGLSLERDRNYRRTTDSYGVIRFDNLLEDLQITHVNQVWQSDITYFELDRFYYITFIIDLYTRVIVGYSVSKSLKTEHTTLVALNMAIKNRQKHKMNIHNLIFHSDGGGQYYDRNFLKLTAMYDIQNSMCKHPWENSYAERLNGVIKNNYLKHRDIKNFEGLVKEVDRSVQLYNHSKPHIGLKRKTPIQFELLSLQKGS